MKTTYLELLKDPRWQKRRLEIFERDGFACTNCESKLNTLHLHHIRYSIGNPWDAPDEYLTTLCEICHMAEEKYKRENPSLKEISENTLIPCFKLLVIAVNIGFLEKRKEQRFLDFKPVINEVRESNFDDFMKFVYGK